MKYKVGDKVRVKSKEWFDKQPNNDYGDVEIGDEIFVPDMREYCGKVATVAKKNTKDGRYSLSIDDGKWSWTDGMIESVEAMPNDTSLHALFSAFKKSASKDKYYEGFAHPRHKLHRDLLDKMHETYKAKNAAYGNSFDKSIDKYGYTAALVRIEDKKNRLDQLLLEGGAVNDEAIEDTCLDMANYSIMLAMYLLDKKGNSEAKSE